MFIPRQLKRKAPTDPHSNTEGVKKARLTSPLPPPNPIPSRSLAPAPDPNIQDAQHDAEILTGLSLIFSDYNRQQGENAGWLKERSRTVEGEDGWIHLSSLLTHPIFSRTRPTLTQKAIRSALERGGHAYPDLELHPGSYHIRRRPSTISTPYSKLSKAVYDLRTIYVEPHLSTLSANPSKLLLHLLTHTHLPTNLLPIQAVSARASPAWAFITFSDVVSEDLAGKEGVWPGGWIVLTKAEHARRDAEYVALLRGQQRQPQHRQIPARSGPSGPSKQAPPPPYVPNLLVQLSNIHPSATKPTIHSFVARHVDRYSRKSAGKGKSSEGGSKRDSSQGVKVDYVDHVANTTMAIVRLGCEADARRVVDAFDGKGRGMGAGDDGRGVRVHGEGGDGVRAVRAELLGGEKERIYWDGIRSKMRKKKGVRGEKGSTVNMTGSGNGRHIRFT